MSGRWLLDIGIFELNALTSITLLAERTGRSVLPRGLGVYTELSKQGVFGAATRNRTPGLLITSELLYLLSYGGVNISDEPLSKLCYSELP